MDPSSFKILTYASVLSGNLYDNVDPDQKVPSEQSDVSVHCLLMLCSSNLDNYLRFAFAFLQGTSVPLFITVLNYFVWNQFCGLVQTSKLNKVYTEKVLFSFRIRDRQYPAFSCYGNIWVL